MKTINTLVDDIYGLMKNRDGWFTDDLSHELSLDVSKRLQLSLNSTTARPTLRLSQMGPKCPRALWYSIRHPEMAELLPPWVVIKFSYGHILEALAIAFSKASGHHVVGEQDEVRVDGIVGHRDCIIDGCLFDVKSSSTYGMAKFQDGTLWKDDSFGYLEQLDGYLLGSADDPLLRVKDKGYILAIDKTLGHMCVYEHEFRPDHIRQRISESKRIVSCAEPPHCECKSIPDGLSGNMRLDVKASYNSYKFACNPEVRTFLYENGPRYLTKVVRRPAAHIMEIDRYGKPVFS